MKIGGQCQWQKWKGRKEEGRKRFRIGFCRWHTTCIRGERDVPAMSCSTEKKRCWVSYNIRGRKFRSAAPFLGSWWAGRPPSNRVSCDNISWQRNTNSTRLTGFSFTTNKHICVASASAETTAKFQVQTTWLWAVILWP